METNGPKVMKLGLKLSLEYPLNDKRYQKFVSPKLGCKGPQFLIKGLKSSPGTRHAATQSLTKWKLMVLET